MKNFVKKALLFLLMLHAIGINVFGFVALHFFFKEITLTDLGLLWLVSVQLSFIGFYFYQKFFPDMVTEPLKTLRSPWLIDIFLK